MSGPASAERLEALATEIAESGASVIAIARSAGQADRSATEAILLATLVADEHARVILANLAPADPLDFQATRMADASGLLMQSGDPSAEESGLLEEPVSTSFVATRWDRRAAPLAFWLAEPHSGPARRLILGPDVTAGQHLQITVPAGCYKAIEHLGAELSGG